jgi:hypothetical protein
LLRVGQMSRKQQVRKYGILVLQICVTSAAVLTPRLPATHKVIHPLHSILKLITIPNNMGTTIVRKPHSNGGNLRFSLCSFGSDPEKAPFPNNFFCCYRGMFTSPLHKSGSSSIVACVFVAAGLCLLSRFLEVNFCFGPSIKAFKRHVLRR